MKNKSKTISRISLFAVLMILFLSPTTALAWSTEDGKSCYTAQSVTLNYEGEVQSFKQSGSSSTTGNAFIDGVIDFFGDLFSNGDDQDTYASWYKFSSPVDGDISIYTTDSTVDSNAILKFSDCSSNSNVASDDSPSPDVNITYAIKKNHSYKLKIYYTPDDNNSSENPTFRPFIVMKQADLNIEKSAPTQVESGSAIRYTLDVRALAGPSMIDAENVSVTDPLPSGVVYSGLSAPSEWSCSYHSGVISCSAASLSPGYSGTITIDGFAPTAVGSYDNTASIASDTTDFNLTDNEPRRHHRRRLRRTRSGKCPG